MTLTIQTRYFSRKEWCRKALWFPCGAEPERLVHIEWVVAGHADGIAHVRDATVLSLLARRTDFDRDHTPFSGVNEGVRDEERVLADLDEFIICQVGRVSARHDLLYETWIDSFLQAQNILVSPHPITERVIVLTPCKYLVKDLNRQLNAAIRCLIMDPFPELRYPIQGIVRIAGGNEDVRVEEVNHGFRLAHTSQ